MLDCKLDMQVGARARMLMQRRCARATGLYTAYFDSSLTSSPPTHSLLLPLPLPLSISLFPPFSFSILLCPSYLSPRPFLSVLPHTSLPLSLHSFLSPFSLRTESLSRTLVSPLPPRIAAAYIPALLSSLPSACQCTLTRT